jgi:protein-serine/threonine kinase
MYYEILLALEFSHRKGIIHRDLKSENILRTREGKIKLCDFGSASSSTNQNNALIGPHFYMAPEVWHSTLIIDKSSDVWSLTVNLYELISGKMPFKNSEQLRNQINYDQLPDNIPLFIKEIISNCF